jgi:hypothetical protein
MVKLRDAATDNALFAKVSAALRNLGEINPHRPAPSSAPVPSDQPKDQLTDGQENQSGMISLSTPNLHGIALQTWRVFANVSGPKFSRSCASRKGCCRPTTRRARARPHLIPALIRRESLEGLLGTEYKKQEEDEKRGQIFVSASRSIVRPLEGWRYPCRSGPRLRNRRTPRRKVRGVWPKVTALDEPRHAGVREVNHKRRLLRRILLESI